MSETYLQEPVSLTQVEILRDGGTIEISLIGADGGSLGFSVDGAIGSPTPDRIWLHASFLEGKSSEMLPKGDPREERVLQLLESWLAEAFSTAELENLRGAYGSRELTEQECKAALCLAAVERVRR